MNNRSLKKHLRYIIPQIRLAIIREPGPSQQPICTPDDIERYVEPLKHHSDFVPKMNMCPSGREGRLRLADFVCCGT